MVESSVSRMMRGPRKFLGKEPSRRRKTRGKGGECALSRGDLIREGPGKHWGSRVPRNRDMSDVTRRETLQFAGNGKS